MRALVPKNDFLLFLFTLILVFLLVTHYTGVSADLKAGFSGTNTLVRSLQGR